MWHDECRLSWQAIDIYQGKGEARLRSMLLFVWIVNDSGSSMHGWNTVVQATLLSIEERNMNISEGFSLHRHTQLLLWLLLS